MIFYERSLSISEIAEKLGVTNSTVRRWVHSGELKGDLRKDGIRIEYADYLTFLDTHKKYNKVDGSSSWRKEKSDILNRIRRLENARETINDEINYLKKKIGL